MPVLAKYCTAYVGYVAAEDATLLLRRTVHRRATLPQLYPGTNPAGEGINPGPAGSLFVAESRAPSCRSAEFLTQIREIWSWAAFPVDQAIPVYVDHPIGHVHVGSSFFLGIAVQRAIAVHFVAA